MATRETLSLAGARSLPSGIFQTTAKVITTRPSIIRVECWLDMSAHSGPMDIDISLEINKGRGFEFLVGATYDIWANDQPTFEVAYFVSGVPRKQNWAGFLARAVLKSTHPLVLMAPGLTVELDESGVQSPIRAPI